MAKKNKKKDKKKKMTFSSFLKRNIEDIVLQEGKDRTKLQEAVDEAVTQMTAVPFDAVLAVSPEEATAGKSIDFGITAHYSGSVYKLFELGMVSDVPYTLMYTIDSDDADILFYPDMHPVMDTLIKKSNLELVLDESKTKLKKLKNWLTEDPNDDLDIFVVTIPNLVLFKSGVRDLKADVCRFNLCFQIVKAKKSITKIKRRGGQVLEELTKFVTKCSMENIKDHGFSNVIIPITEDFAEDAEAVIDEWLIMLDVDESFPKLVNRVNFTTKDTSAYAIVSKGCLDYEEKKHRQ